jgi:hypothetical protein
MSFAKWDLATKRGEESVFIGIGKHPKLDASREDIQISRITCYAKPNNEENYL